MAKLKAYGRTELFKVEKEREVTNSDLITWEKVSYALMSDGKVLERRVVLFKPSSYEPKGRRHDYGWKEHGRLKAEGDPNVYLESLKKKGYTLVGVPNLGALRSDYKESREKAAKAAAQHKADAPKRVAADLAKNGPGFYVRNRYTGHSIASEMSLKQWATNFGPATRAEDCLKNAESTLSNYRVMRFDYLLPVQIVQAASRKEAEHGGGTIWWTNGKVASGLAAKADDAPKPVAADPRQMKLF